MIENNINIWKTFCPVVVGMINIRSGNFNPIKRSITQKYSVALLKLIDITLETNESKRPTVYDLLNKLPERYLDKNETTCYTAKNDINLQHTFGAYDLIHYFHIHKTER